jgi:hypothetical protein
LAPALALRAPLARAGDQAGLDALFAADREMRLRLDTERLRWETDGLRVEIHATLTDRAGQPLRLVADGERRFLPFDRDRRVDVVPALREATASIYLKHRGHGAEWHALPPTPFRLRETADGAFLEVELEAVVDRLTFPFGAPLAPGRYGLSVRAMALGYGMRTSLTARAEGTPPGKGVTVVHDKQGRTVLIVPGSAGLVRRALRRLRRLWRRWHVPEGATIARDA